jgi:hypothetical protein
MFREVLLLGDLQAERLGHRDVALVHDQQQQFSPYFRGWWKRLREWEPCEENFPNGQRLRLPLRCLTSFTEADSSSEAGIQVADIVASAMRLLAQEQIAGPLDRSAAFAEVLNSLCRAQGLNAIGPPGWP